MDVGKNGIELIKKYESCSLKAYKGSGEKYYTIGYGHYGADVKANQTITQAKADSLLKSDLKSTVDKVNTKAKKFKLTQNQFDALVSYCYNRGPKGLEQLIFNSKTVKELGENIVVYWGSNEKVKKGLLNRRKAEQKLFLTK